MTIAPHNVVCVEVPNSCSSKVTYYEDADFLTDEASAMLRITALCGLGKRAWLERFYGTVSNIGKESHVRVRKPQEEESPCS